ncbi:MAG: SpoIIE family protein phosphatase [Bacteroidetes bacterium]|nr:SpoIIE family protein phosphatase [Bacteroidota bacterium]
MNRSATPDPALLSLESDLNAAITRNLTLKSKILAVFFGIIFLAQLIGFMGTYFAPGYVPEAVLKMFSIPGFYLLPAGIAFFALCETGMYFALKRLRRMNRTVPVWLSYTISIIETTFPTLGLYFMLDLARNSGTIGGADILDTPPAFIYYFFIVLAALQMDFRLCLWTGIASAAQFIFIKLCIADSMPDAGTRTLDLQAERSFLFIAFGIIAGFVSAKIRESVISALKNKNELIYNLDNLVQQRTREVVEQKNRIEEQNTLLEEKNRNISDSITYAQRIQKAMIPTEQCVKDILPGSFVLYKPKDIVSGDFYFAEKVEHKIVFSVIDCTGHGVPGALMSVIGFKYLEQAVNEKGILSPAEILAFLNQGVRHTLRHSAHLFSAGKIQNEVKDGMDLALCVFNTQTLELHYAGAFNSLYYIRDGILNEIRGERYSIGETDQNFTQHTLAMQQDDALYLSSDGYEDQFGGPKGKKFKAARFKELLKNIAGKPMDEQKSILESEISSWQGKAEQTDDICVMGVRIE